MRLDGNVEKGFLASQSGLVIRGESDRQVPLIARLEAD
jgi:hypothetical protein